MLRSALVTGGGVRIGRALALALAREGLRVVVHYHRSADDADDVVRTITAAGGEAVAIQADLAKVEEIERLAREAEGAFGGVDVLVNNASVFPSERFEQTDAALWDHTLAVNLRAPFFLTKLLAPGMRTRGSGVVINLADLAGLQPWAAYAAHSISKAGIVQLTKVSARALAPEIRVNAIAPGAVLPPESFGADQVHALAEGAPLKVIGSPDDVVGAMLYLLRAPFVTGVVLPVDGGRLLRS